MPQAARRPPVARSRTKVDWIRCIPFIILHLGCLGVLWGRGQRLCGRDGRPPLLRPHCSAGHQHLSPLLVPQDVQHLPGRAVFPDPLCRHDRAARGALVGVSSPPPPPAFRRAGGRPFPARPRLLVVAHRLDHQPPQLSHGLHPDQGPGEVPRARVPEPLRRHHPARLRLRGLGLRQRSPGALSRAPHHRRADAGLGLLHQHDRPLPRHGEHQLPGPCPGQAPLPDRRRLPQQLPPRDHHPRRGLAQQPPPLPERDAQRLLLVGNRHHLLSPEGPVLDRPDLEPEVGAEVRPRGGRARRPPYLPSPPPAGPP